MSNRVIHPDFLKHLKHKEDALINLYLGLRDFILEIHPKSNELLYHTHALTSLYSVSKKMSDGFCMIPIYTNHLNLAFNKGTILNDSNKLLQGTGKWMRHISIKTEVDFKNKEVEKLIQSAIDLALEDSTAKEMNKGITISKIKN
ncbi:DUF1801 domain-containing protein [Polaribacter porphyrae]|uniref:DUF1801 domain-containing protein n=1 Tax=Polaribacter porphyrae TaxID=1137780 RepID=UPI001CFFBD40|nr:DUF1801 domain-containing protein [Polaribacter porphyrae]